MATEAVDSSDGAQLTATDTVDMSTEDRLTDESSYFTYDRTVGQYYWAKESATDAD